MLSRPSTGQDARSLEKQFYHQNIDINYIEKDLYIHDDKKGDLES